MSIGRLASTKEDLEQNTADTPAVMQRQVLVIQKAPRTTDVPLLQYIDTTAFHWRSDAEKTLFDTTVFHWRSDAEKTPQKTARGLHNEVQRNPV